jgi:hypothetical protein
VRDACGAAHTGVRADAKPLYDKHCRRCHGINGEGNQKITSMMKVEIRRLGWLTDKEAVDLVR